MPTDKKYIFGRVQAQRLPTTNHELPTTNYQPRTTNHELPTTNYQLLNLTQQLYVFFQNTCRSK
ncbi:alpha/beta hydrolase [Sphingobacterium psychroaquaticum]|nr:alpha/beta hydrolase [Sphingobacterium psychroaquaticum]